MTSTEFIAQTNQHRKTRLLFLGTLAILIIIAAIAASNAELRGSISTGDVPLIGGLLPSAERGITITTLFTSAAFSGLFFVPVPIEAVFVLSLRQGNPALPALLAVLGGFVLGQTISYLIGWKLSRTLSSLVSAKKMYALRRKVAKYGAYAILLFNLVPLPSPQLTFGLGLTRYNPARLFTLLIIGNTIKFSVIIALSHGLLAINL